MVSAPVRALGSFLRTPSLSALTPERSFSAREGSGVFSTVMPTPGDAVICTFWFQRP